VIPGCHRDIFLLSFSHWIDLSILCMHLLHSWIDPYSIPYLQPWQQQSLLPSSYSLLPPSSSCDTVISLVPFVFRGAILVLITIALSCPIFFAPLQQLLLRLVYVLIMLRSKLSTLHVFGRRLDVVARLLLPSLVVELWSGCISFQSYGPMGGRIL
jgi:hypothetical protein